MKNKTEELKKEAEKLELKRKSYLSYSRAFLFHTNKLSFVKKYFLGEKKPESSNQAFLKKMHQVMQSVYNPNYVISESPPEGVIKPKPSNKKAPPKVSDKKNGVQWIPLVKKKVTDETEFFKNYKRTLDLQEFSWLKDILKSENTKYELKETRDDLQLTGYLDVVNFGDPKIIKGPQTIIELKGQDYASFCKMKFRYGLQQVIYRKLFGPDFNFYFVLIPTSYPYSMTVAHFSDDWIGHCEDIFKDIEKYYWGFIDAMEYEFPPEILWAKEKAEEIKFKIFNKSYELLMIKSYKVVEDRDWEFQKTFED